MFNILTYYVNQASTWMNRTMAFNSAYKELDSLTDKELADLGISRCELPYVVSNTLKQRIPSRSF